MSTDGGAVAGFLCMTVLAGEMDHATWPRYLRTFGHYLLKSKLAHRADKGPTESSPASWDGSIQVGELR